jgi:hypothetical protein
MRYIVVGVVGVLCGALLLLEVMRRGMAGEGFYYAGQVLALASSPLLIASGAYALFTGIVKIQGDPKSLKRKAASRWRDED